ncbi:MAG TPA: alpha/beta fold hydrolase [Nocardioidaceae bacterium]|nr:alpha/beta fold hydrolase [Nocardioidaceae bacterium]
MRRFQWSLLLVAVLLLTTSCATSAATSAVSDRGSVPSSSVAAAHNDTTTPFNLVSLPALVEHEYDAGPLRVDHLVADELASRRFHVTYRSGPLTVSGQLSVPRRPGRLPLVVLAHGYESPGTYRSGVALAREQAFLAARGYVVLLTDYRNHADSDREGTEPVAEPLGYPEDVVNAVLAARRLPFVDTGRVAVVGRSMGGGVALAAVAARPELVDALVLYSPVSSDAVDNYRRWVAGRPDLEGRVRATYGTPGENPRFWRRASVRNYVGRVDVPVQVHHGTADEVCPVSWSRETVTALREAGQTVEYFEYPGEGHRLDAGWSTMARRIAGFLDRHV